MTERRFGMLLEEWAAARDALEALLLEAATSRRTVTYGEAARRAFGGRFSARSGALMALLGEVDSAMLEERGIMIATLVVRADTGRPGDGYFAFAEGVGEVVGDRETYWAGQAQLVWDAFAESGPL